MNDNKEGSPSCYLHPREGVIGICAICLKERLLVLATKQGNNELPLSKSFKPSIAIPKLFALSFFLHRRRFRRRNDDAIEENYIPSLDDSFISIKFESDGRASWADQKSGKGSSGKSVIEHRGGLKWKKKVGHLLLQIIRWKRASKPSPCHAGLTGKADVAAAAGKGRRDWMRSLTRRRSIADL